MVSTRIRLIALDSMARSSDEPHDLAAVQDSIARARAQGTQITIVTGRMFAAAKPFALTLGITGPLVCYQGAAIFEASTAPCCAKRRSAKT